jgi:argininosuccinate lyase
LFDLIDTVKDCLFAYSEMMPAVSCNKDEMYAAAKQGYATATDLADYLVKQGMAFRDAHEVVGKSVAFGIEKKKDLADLSLAELQNFSDLITEDVFEVLTLEGSISARDHIGGTAPSQVLAAVATAKTDISKR